jgi:hypothetical protein
VKVKRPDLDLSTALYVPQSMQLFASLSHRSKKATVINRENEFLIATKGFVIFSKFLLSLQNLSGPNFAFIDESLFPRFAAAKDRSNSLFSLFAGEISSDIMTE